MTSHLLVSDRGVQFVARWEGLRLAPYNDAGGNATIGYGTLLHTGPVTKHDVDDWRGFTASRALELLRRDVWNAANHLNETVDPPIRLQHRFDALASFVYNVGTGAWDASTLRRMLNRGIRDVRAADQLLRWTHAAGVALPGLVNRRMAERRLYLHNSYDG